MLTSWSFDNQKFLINKNEKIILSKIKGNLLQKIIINEFE